MGKTTKKPKRKNSSRKGVGGAKKKLLEEKKLDGWDLLNSLVQWASQEYCAEQLQIDPGTLSTRIKEKFNCSFSEYKNLKKEPMRINIRKKQYDVAMKGNVQMLTWVGKQECEQSDKSANWNHHEMGGPVFVEDDGEDDE